MLVFAWIVCGATLTGCGGGGSGGGGASENIGSTGGPLSAPQVAPSPAPTPTPVIAPTPSGPAPIPRVVGASGLDADSAIIGTGADAQLPADATTQVTYARTVYVDAGHAAASDSGTGSAAAPYRSIAAAVRNLRPGDDVVVAAGTYREGIVVPDLNWGSTRTRLRAMTARTVLVKGSQVVAGWTAAAAGAYWVDWSGEEPQQVYRDGLPLQQIAGTVFGGYPTNAANELALAHADEGGIWPGRVNGTATTMPADSFIYEATTRRLYIRPATPLTTAQAVEVSVLRHVLQAENASGLTVQGLDFAHSNTSVISRWGAVKVNGQNNLLTDLTVSDMDGTCVQVSGSDNTLSYSTIQRCGQTGITGLGQRLTITNNRVTNANTRGFNKWWEAGGMKLIGDGGLHDSVVRHNIVAYNHGDGIWLDWLNSRNLIEGNTTAYNEGFGIHHEASQFGTLRANLSYGNTMRGIYLNESSNCSVESNSAFGNVMEGIGIVDGTRSATNTALKPVNNSVTGNSVAWNDFNRNWVQLVLPGLSFGAGSDRNSFKAETLLPRLSLGFIGPTNPAYTQLASWRTASGMDGNSTEQLVGMPAALKALLTQKKLLSAAEVPAFLKTPGTY